MKKSSQTRGLISRPRVWFVEALLLACLAGVAARAVQLQIFHSEKLLGLAEGQYLKELKLSAPRGNILDHSGRTLSVSVVVQSVSVNPRELEESSIGPLAEALAISEQSVRKKIGRRKTFAWIKRRVLPQEAEAVRALALKGVHLTDESRRFYPNRELAAHVLGFVGLDGEGLAGLERQYDERLRGRTADVGVLRDARGRPLSTGDILPVTSLEGDNVYLTIDAAIQHDAEEILAQAVTQYQAASGMAVVMDPRTGALLALAVVPTFNPNDAGKAAAASRRNRVITDVFEPGSTLKPLIVASALERGVIQVDQEIFCEDGAISIGKHVIRDAHPHGILDIGGVIAKSSNIGALKIGMELGADQLHLELQRWGLGARTGIELPGEVKGMLASPKRWSKARIATISFGQGVGVTALQLTAAVAAIADQGRWRTPYVVSRVVAQDGSVRIENKGSAPRQVVRPEIAQAMSRMMERVVQPGGTGIRASLPGIRVAGKTGTAQKVDPVAGGYSADKRISSFVGFAPAEDPRAVVVVVVDEPRGATYGGVVAGPAFREIMRSTLRNLGINVATEQVAQVAPAQPSGGSTTLSEDALAAREAAPEPSAISVRTPEVNSAETELDAMPDLRGLDARRAAARLLSAGLELQLEGRGRVVEQEPAPGASLEGVSSARLLLAQGRG